MDKTPKKREWFEILGVSETAKEEDVKKAYHRLAVEYHPDKNQGQEDKAEQMFKKVNEAYFKVQNTMNTLSALKSHFRSPDIHRSLEQFYFMNEGSLTTLKLSKSAEFGTQPTEQKKAPKKGQSLQTSISVDFHEVVRGCRKIIEFRRSINCQSCAGKEDNRKNCLNCKGHGRFEVNRTTVVDIMPGTSNGTVKTLVGEGDEGDDGGVPGDLMVVCKVTPHPFFEREGEDVHCKIALPFPLAILGSKIDIPSLMGDMIKIIIEPGCQHEQVIKIAGEGFPCPDSPSKRGDMYLKISIQVPKSLTDEEKQILKLLAGKPSFKSLFEATPLDPNV